MGGDKFKEFTPLQKGGKQAGFVEKVIVEASLDLIEYGYWAQLVEFLLNQTSSIRDIENFRTFQHSQRIRVSLAVLNTMLEVARRPAEELGEILAEKHAEKPTENSENSKNSKTLEKIENALQKFISEEVL